jgi:hypothetical protein
LGKALAPAAGAGTTKLLFVFRSIGGVQRAAIQTDQPPPTVPGSLGAFLGNGEHHSFVQLFQRLGSQPASRLRDSRLAGDPYRYRRIQQPLHSFQQTTQYFAIRRSHVQRQRDHVVDDDVSGQIPLTDAGAFGLLQNRIHLLARKKSGNHAQADVIGDAAPSW